MTGFPDFDAGSGSPRSALRAILLEDKHRTRTELAIFLVYAVLALAGSLFGSGLLTLPGRLPVDLPAWLLSPAFVSLAALAGMTLLATTAILVHQRRRERLTLAVELLELRARGADSPLA